MKWSCKNYLQLSQAIYQHYFIWFYASLCPEAVKMDADGKCLEVGCMIITHAWNKCLGKSLATSKEAEKEDQSLKFLYLLNYIPEFYIHILHNFCAVYLLKITLAYENFHPRKLFPSVLVALKLIPKISCCSVLNFAYCLYCKYWLKYVLILTNRAGKGSSDSV